MQSRATRRSFLTGAGAAAVAGLAGCSELDSGSGSGSERDGGVTDSGGSGSRTLTMIDWSYVYSNDVIAEFEERHDCTVERQAAQGSAETLAQLRTGRADYDLVPLGNYAVTPAIEEGYLQPLDLDQVPAYGAVFDFLKKDYFERDGDVYGVPRSFGQTPLAINTDLVSREITALADLWDPELDGLAGGRDDARLQALYRNAVVGEELNPTSVDDVDRGALRSDLVDRLELTGGLWNNGGESEQLLRTKQVGVQPVWNYVIQAMQAENVPIDRVFPEEGTKAWFIQFTVREGAEHPDLAHTFIQEWFTEMGYESLMAPSNIAIPSDRVFDERNVDRSTFGLDDPEQFIYEDPKPRELVEAYSRTWSEAKAEANV